MPPSPSAPPPDAGENPLVPNSLLRELATTMQALRALRQRGTRGQEAVRASALLTLRPGDLVCDLSGSDAGRTLDLPSHPLWLDPPSPHPAQSLLVLLGAAQALAAQGKHPTRPTPGSAALADSLGASLLLVFLSATSLKLADWRSTLDLAARNALPLLLLTLPDDPPRAGELSDRSRGFGAPGIPVDATDAVALCRVLSESALRARHGDGPSLIEAIAWQLSPRPEDPLRKHLSLLRQRRLLPFKAPPTPPPASAPSRLRRRGVR